MFGPQIAMTFLDPAVRDAQFESVRATRQRRDLHVAQLPHLSGTSAQESA